MYEMVAQRPGCITHQSELEQLYKVVFKAARSFALLNTCICTLLLLLSFRIKLVHIF